MKPVEFLFYFLILLRCCQFYYSLKTAVSDVIAL